MHGDMSRAFNKGILWFTNFTDWLVGVTSGQNDVQTPQAESDGESRTCFTDVDGFRFPPEVDKGIVFCEHSKKDMNNISRSVEAMLSCFKTHGLSPHETIGEQCNQIGSKAITASIGGAMKEVHSTYTELGRIERKSYDEVKYSVVIEAVSMNKVEDWMRNGVGKQLDDISELKKRRLEKDACATSANSHPDDQERANRSAAADQEYNSQLAVVQEDLRQLSAHYGKTAREVKSLMKMLADHYDKAYNTTHAGAAKVVKV
uniref:BAR domain-containing protein n=1 Tax=Ascaris lumbricoides TaxID=6252 RepID=A0A0M3I9T9_ASCLU